MPEDDVRKALETMQERKVRRLPVVAPDGTLEGILSISDITLNAKETTGNKVPEISFRDLVQTYKALCARALPAEQASKSMTATGVTAVERVSRWTTTWAEMDHKAKPPHPHPAPVSDRILFGGSLGCAQARLARVF